MNEFDKFCEGVLKAVDDSVDYDPEELAKGIEVVVEHTGDVLYHSDDNNKMHPFPKSLLPLMRKWFEETKQGWFSAGEYDENEISYLKNEEGRVFTDGSELREKAIKYWERYEEILNLYGDESFEADYFKWKDSKIESYDPS